MRPKEQCKEVEELEYEHYSIKTDKAASESMFAISRAWGESLVLYVILTPKNARDPNCLIAVGAAMIRLTSAYHDGNGREHDGGSG